MAESKIGPKEAMLRKQREERAARAEAANLKVKAKAIGKVQSVKVAKRGRTGR